MEKIGKYTILQKIGRGGMGYVYRAHDPILRRDVALKTMLRHVSEDPELRDRFIREAQSAGGLRHPNIVTIYDLGEDAQGCPFIAMEFLQGTDLEQVIKNKTDLSLSRKLEIVIQMCKGLGFAHANGIVHRDIKAANIRLLDNGLVKIMDFGIAKMASSHFTRTGMIMGTPHYMAPEQIRGEKVDGRADIFSVGVVLYELLTYRKPFPGDNPTTVLFKIIHDPPEPLIDTSFHPPNGLEDVVTKALAKKPTDRYETCEEMAEDLEYVRSNLTEQRAAVTEVGGGEMAPQTAQGPAPSVSPGGGARKATDTAARKTEFLLPSQQKRAQAALTGEQTVIQEGVTSFEPPTQKTVHLAPGERPGGGHTPDLPPVSATPARDQQTPFWWIVGSSGILGIALLILVFLGAFRNTKPNPAQPEVQVNQPPKVVVQQATLERKGWIMLNPHPWAEITNIQDANGQAVPVAIKTTPCRLQLPEGNYRITLANSNYETKILEVKITADQTTIIQENLKGFDYAKAVRSLGL